MRPTMALSRLLSKRASWAASWPSTNMADAVNPDTSHNPSTAHHASTWTKAIASWTEQIRDTLAAANGLEHAIGATATLAPEAIAASVARLAARIDYESFPDALRRFADEVEHPMADFVVAALVIASEKEARDVGALLGSLAEAARDEARMRSRVWVGRARSRSAIRIIIGVVVVFVLGLLALNRDYLRPYDSPGGQAILGGILAMFGASFVAMERIGRIRMPQRFIVRRTEDAVAR